MSEAPAAAAVSSGPSAAAVMDMGLSEEEALLQQALAMSMNENEPTSEPSAAASATSMEEDDEAAAMQLALQMSMQPDQPKEEEGFQDQEFVNNLIGNLPGVNPNDLLNDNNKDDDDDGKKKDDDA